MTTVLRPRRRLLGFAVALAAFIGATVAYADNVANDLGASSGVATTTPGGSVAVSWRINETGNDGCSPASGAASVVSLTPSGPVSASSTTLTFTTCDSPQTVTFTAASDAEPGDYSVAVSVDDADGDSFQGADSVVIRVVAPTPTDTAPVVTAPPDQALEATSPTGTSQTFTGTAVDDVDGALPAPCSPTTFPLGSTSVTCTATDSGGNTGTASFTVTVRDTTPPALALPAAITTGATTPSGAVVAYTASSADVVDGPVAVACAPPSGSTFAVGETTVTCTATDARGNSASGAFTVTITNSGPTIVVPGTQIAEAGAELGAVVNFVPQPTASDRQDGPLVPTCSPASGARFGLGTTTVVCTATDSSGASGRASFDVVVRDSTAPVVTAPRDFVVITDTPLPRSDPRISQFLSAVRAADLVGVVRLESDAPPVLPLGSTVVTFKAADLAGNEGLATARIELRPPTPGAPTPPAPPDPVRVPPANVGDLRVLLLDRAVRLVWRRAPTAARYVVTRSDRVGATRPVYDGGATAFVDRGLVNGEEYRYVVVSYDRDGLRSVGVAIVAVPQRPVLISPRYAAGVSRPPALRWRRVPRATYYNLQLFRVSGNGTRAKVMTVWPAQNRFQLQTKWWYGRKLHRLTRGTYEWYLWAGYGRREAKRYGPLLGWSRFAVRRTLR